MAQMDALSPSVVSKEHDGRVKSAVHHHTDLPRYPDQLLAFISEMSFECPHGKSPYQ